MTMPCMVGQVAQKIKGYVQLAGSLQSLLQQLVRDHAELQANQGAAQACKDLQALLDLLQSCQVLLKRVMLPHVQHYAARV